MTQNTTSNRGYDDTVYIPRQQRLRPMILTRKVQQFYLVYLCFPDGSEMQIAAYRMHKSFYIKIQFSKFNINNCQMRKTAIPIKNIFVKKTGKFLKKVRCAEKKKSQSRKIRLSPFPDWLVISPPINTYTHLPCDFPIADKAKNSNKAFQKNIFKFSTQHFHESTSTIRTSDESTVNHRSQSVM